MPKKSKTQDVTMRGGMNVAPTANPPAPQKPQPLPAPNEPEPQPIGPTAEPTE